MPQETYRGEGHQRAPECTLEAHFRQIQAITDALMFAAQLEMTQAIEAGDDAARERAYGKWIGVKGVSRAAEMATYDFTPTELEMWKLIDWENETFNFPGKEAFPSLSEQHLPGEGT